MMWGRCFVVKADDQLRCWFPALKGEQNSFHSYGEFIDGNVDAVIATLRGNQSPPKGASFDAVGIDRDEALGCDGSPPALHVIEGL
jgi:hypothetical protein